MDIVLRILFFFVYLVLFFLVTVLPGLVIFGVPFILLFRKIKRKVVFIYIFSLLGSLVAPISVYLVGYTLTNGWKDGDAEIFLYVIFGFPVIYVAFIIAFFMINRIMLRRIK